MIHFAPYEFETSEPLNAEHGRPEGTRMLFIEDTDIYIGEIIKGQAMTNLKSNWTEWQFYGSQTGDVNGDLVTVAHKAGRGIGEAYAAARKFAAERYPEHA